MSVAQRRALCLAYNFPPMAGGEVARIHAFVKYLPRYGYTPRVLTVAMRWHGEVNQDAALLQEYSDETCIVRTPSLMPAGAAAQALRADILGTRPDPLPLSGLIKRTLRIPYRLLVIPDESILWLPYALRAGWLLAKERRPEVIVATTPPHGVGVIGALLSRLIKIPMVLDVRDDWVDNPFYAHQSGLRQWTDRLLERFVISTAGRVVVVTSESRELLRAKYPDRNPEFFELIPNGFDPDGFSGSRETDLPSSLRRPRRSQLRVVYTGNLPTKRSPEGFLRAIQELKQGRPALSAEVEVIIAGTVRREYQTLIQSLNVEDVVLYVGALSPRAALGIMRTADVGLVIIPAEEGGQTAIPGKIYEYMAAGLLVLALADRDSAVARLIDALKIGVVVPQHDSHAIAQALRQLLARVKRGPLSPRIEPEVLNRYNRVEHTRQLAQIFDELV